MNRSVFDTLRAMLTRANTVNEAGGAAYMPGPREALAQLAATGTFGNTFYVSGDEQLGTIRALLPEVEPEYVARLAVYARQRGRMKDTPSVLLAWLFANGHSGLAAKAFPRVVDNGRMLRNFVQVIRSGTLGRRSFGTSGRRLIRDWIAAREPVSLWRDSIGESPSMRDILRMVHPKPMSEAQSALFAYLGGKPYREELLPPAIAGYERFVRGVQTGETGDVPEGADFRWLANLGLSVAQWRQVAERMSPMALRMNLNSLAKKGVFEDMEYAARIAARIAGAGAARQFPHQFLAAIGALNESVPQVIRTALGSALDKSLANVPAFEGRTLVFVDVSGSMDSPITGSRKSATSKVRAVDVAALFAAAVLRSSNDVDVYWFHTAAGRLALNPRDSLETITHTIVSSERGGTDASAPLKLALEKREKAKLVIWISDEQSWAAPAINGVTATASLWADYRRKNRGAKAVHINLQPAATVQVPGAADVLNVGGFSDAVWDVIRAFSTGDEKSFVTEVESVTL